ncbi:MAG TPA: alpha-1,4-glucan--maltose-1-phosphate maltosyltransferase [Actinomycetota bacterium]|nr:alpha-1,4-glucan--maltose-1-phosphate maltosyltransferase [Actinomycetota bacterium]
MKLDTDKGHVIIENVAPAIGCGRHRAKAVVGDLVEVAADLFRDGPDLLQASLRYRGPQDSRWCETPMTLVENDRWSGSFSPDRIGRWRYTIEAWTDHFSTWRRKLMKKVEVGENVDLELEEGARLIEARLGAMPAKERKTVSQAVELIRRAPEAADGTGFADPRVVVALSDAVGLAMTKHADRSRSSVYKPILELHVDRERARYGAWYELFPRSTGTKTKHGTFKTATERLPQIADMGFDVVYLPPIHPIGTAFRKGKNNSLQATPKDVGSPWAIGNVEGGHTAIHPQLGTIEDFDAFVAEAERLGLEVALDYAIQCSPDHPWVTEHPEWFHHRPDGTIQYAENPPKKYQDVYHVNFDTDNADELWTELKAIVDFWIEHGVKIFRVDNPHTKPFPFWEWLISSIHDEHPDVIFLAEAFTRPKVMQGLAKLGFTQSYTYFTWRNHKAEIEEYLTELTRTEMAHYFRPNFFANTPDILHEYLQEGGPPAFKIRLILAAFLSPTYGIYSGYELFENLPVRAGSEEYSDSEKYELRPRDLAGSDNLVDYVTKVNDIRRKHPALSEFTNLHFHTVDKENVMAFSKSTVDGDTILVVLTLNPYHWEEGTVHLDLDALGVDPSRSFEVHDLLADTKYVWHGPQNYVRLDPHHEPAHVFRVGG